MKQIHGDQENVLTESEKFWNTYRKGFYVVMVAVYSQLLWLLSDTVIQIFFPNLPWLVIWGTWLSHGIVLLGLMLAVIVSNKAIKVLKFKFCIAFLLGYLGTVYTMQFINSLLKEGNNLFLLILAFIIWFGFYGLMLTIIPKESKKR